MGTIRLADREICGFGTLEKWHNTGFWGDQKWPLAMWTMKQVGTMAKIIEITGCVLVS